MNESKKRVFITGAAGRIGAYVAEQFRDRYNLRLMVLPDDEAAQRIADFGEVVHGDLANLERLKELCAGVDTVVHLAANPSPNATWDELLPTNIIGTYHLFVAARAAGCKRVIYASSIHAVSGYPVDVQVKNTEPVNPDDLYGVSKCFGEALGRYMAEQENLSVIAIRIGAYRTQKAARRVKNLSMIDAWISQRDLAQLIEKSIEAQNITFAILHGMSDNRFKRLDISNARQLVGYAPQDDLTEENFALKSLHLNDAIDSHAQKNAAQAGIRDDLSAPSK